jgi:hypothetical protein
MVNHFRKDMKQPIVGTGTSFYVSEADKANV